MKTSPLGRAWTSTCIPAEFQKLTLRKHKPILPTDQEEQGFWLCLIQVQKQPQTHTPLAKLGQALSQANCSSTQLDYLQSLLKDIVLNIMARCFTIPLSWTTVPESTTSFGFFLQIWEMERRDCDFPQTTNQPIWDFKFCSSTTKSKLSSLAKGCLKFSSISGDQWLILKTCTKLAIVYQTEPTSISCQNVTTLINPKTPSSHH